MDNALMIGLSRQLTLRREMEITANNIANANTPGFHVETLLMRSQNADTARAQDGPQQLQYVDAWGVGRDFREGPLDFTGRPLDVALEGDGFFQIEGADGEALYTRDGRFRLDSEGRLSSADGAPVLDDLGAPILIEAALGEVMITEDGALVQNNAEIARLGVYRFDDLALLEKSGNGRYAAGEAQADIAADATVRQGYVETSNVQPILELTRMIETMRAYESVSRFLSQGEEANRKAIERLGRA
ncbi:flagellar basal-body rod protein FlgF [Hyphobacterium sp.]|jgi:flagellar basal-body rod protein FlgF|uniref:flagellar basal-body rod protein FlgF n=1 Tax=Hyphobacterium sp. TaxID=2004662 RepID=UPI003BACC2D1